MPGEWQNGGGKFGEREVKWERERGIEYGKEKKKLREGEIKVRKKGEIDREEV